MKKYETSEILEIDDRSDIPMFVVEQTNELFTIVCNKAGFLVINEYLESYASDCTEKDLQNPYAQ